MKVYFANIVKQTAMSAIVLFALSCAAFAQAEDFPNFKSTQSGKGIMLMNKKGAPDYAILIPGGTEAEYDAADGALKVKIADGGGEVRAYYADAKLYAKTKRDAPETLMKNFRAAHLAQIEAERKQKILIDEEFSGELPAFDLRQGKDEKTPVYTSFWSFPISGAKPERRIYLAVVIGDSILILQKDLFNGENAQEESRVFTSAHKTLTLMPPQNPPAAPKKQTIKPRRGKS